MRAEILSIGTELLLGQIVDTNAQYLAARLADLGIDCLYISTVGDNPARCREALGRALGRSDLVISTGGLGPTEDDLTRETIAAVLGEEPVVDPALERELREWFAGRGVSMPERNRKQLGSSLGARDPEPERHGAGLGRSEGRQADHRVARSAEGDDLYWEHHVEPTLVAGAVLRSRTVKTLGIGESSAEEVLGDLVRSTRRPS